MTDPEFYPISCHFDIFFFFFIKRTFPDIGSNKIPTTAIPIYALVEVLNHFFSFPIRDPYLFFSSGTLNLS